MEDDDINSDPPKCKEEWFDVAISLAKEFKLPNLSCPLFKSLIDYHSDNLNLAINNNNPIPSTWPAIFVENRQVAATSSMMRTPNQSQVQFSEPLPSNNNVGGVNLPVDNKQAIVHSLSNSSPNFSNSGTNNPWSGPNQNPMSNLNNFSETATTQMISSSEPGSSSSSNGPLTWKEPETLDPSEDQDNDQKLVINTGVSEPRSDDSDESRDHKCIVCKMTFPGGEALGSHMISSHAKRRKIEAMKNGGISMEEEEDTKGSLTSKSAANFGEKIDGSEPSSKVDDDGDGDAEKEDKSSSSGKVA